MAMLLVGGCATSSTSRRAEPPDDERAFGVTFGAPRQAVEQALSDGGLGRRPDPADPDALLVEACPGAPRPGGCRLSFGPAGLYAAEQEAPLAELEALVSEVARRWGEPRRSSTSAAVGTGATVVAAWERHGWTVAVSRSAEPSAALFRAEYDLATPPVVSGVPLGHRRDEVERALVAQGASLIQRDEDAVSYLGCPQGDPDAVSCTISFRRGRAAAVTEVMPGSIDEKAAMEAWRQRTEAVAKEIGRPPDVTCPSAGPQRVGGECTATWRTARLVVVVGAHRGAGSQHRGAIAVYTGYSYPALGRDEDASGP